MNKVYIVGGAQTDFERNWKKEGKNMIALLKEVISDGLENVGLSFDDIYELNKKTELPRLLVILSQKNTWIKGILAVF